MHSSLENGSLVMQAGNNKSVMKNKAVYIFAIFLLIVLLAVGAQKTGWNVDEYYTFILSNSGMDAFRSIESGDTYSGKAFFEKLCAVNQDNKFNVSNVINNQADDVHPPLYYLVVNTFCSILSDSGYLQIVGIGLNIILAILCYFVFIKILNLFIANERVVVIISFFFCLSYAFLNTVLFMRMYMMLMFFTALFLYILLKYEPLTEKKPLKFYISLFFVSVLGCLTQYYYIIFLCSACLVYGILLIRYKKIKELIGGVAAVIGALGVAFLLFPAMYKHIFKGYRGTASFESLVSSDFIASLTSYLSITNKQLFGGMLFIIGICLVLFLFTRKSADSEGQPDRYLLLIIPSLISFLLIAKTAPYQTFRYISNLFFCFYFFVFILLYRIFSSHGKPTWIPVLLLGIICLISGLDNYPLSYQYQEEEENRSLVAELNEENTICLFMYEDNSKWHMLPNCLQMKEMDEIVFYSFEDYGDIDYDMLATYDNLLVYVPQSGGEIVVEDISEQSGKLSSQQLFSFGYTTAVLLK